MNCTEKYINVEEALALKYAEREQEKKAKKEESKKRLEKPPLPREEKERHLSPV